MKKLIFVLLALASRFAVSQTTVAPFVNPKVQFFNGAVPCSGCLLSTFAAGTTTPLATYSESTGTTPNSNPIQLDANGLASIYLTSASYKFVLKTAANVTIWTQDNVTWRTPISTFAGLMNTVTFSATPVFDASIYTLFKLTLTGNVTSSTLLNATAGEPINFQICQDGTGGRAFVAPTNVLGFGPISTTASACTSQGFIYDGTNALATGPAQQATTTLVNGIAFGDTTLAAPGLFRNATTATEVKVGMGSNGVNTGAGIAVTTQNTDGVGLGNGGIKVGGNACYQAGSGGLGSFASFVADAFLSRNAANIWQVGSACGNSSGELDMRTVGITGSTSGKTSLITDATASGSPTLKAGTYNIVGDSLTQTLTGKSLTSPTSTGTDNGAEILQQKTLQGAGSGNAVTLLNSQDPLGAVTGNGTDQTLYTFTIPANTVAAGKGFRVRAFVLSNNAVAVTYKLIVGATTVFTIANASGIENDVYSFEVFNNAATQAAQTAIVSGSGGATVVTSSVTTPAENFANAITVKITANEVAANTVTPKKWFIELIQ